LAVFLLHANKTLGADRLIDELRRERSPATAAKTGQVYVSTRASALFPSQG
jgi:hypothetical protein